MKTNSQLGFGLAAGHKDTGVTKRLGLPILLVGWAAWMAAGTGRAGPGDSLSVAPPLGVVHASHVGNVSQPESTQTDDDDGGSCFPGAPSVSPAPAQDAEPPSLTDEVSGSGSTDADEDYGVWWSVPWLARSRPSIAPSWREAAPWSSGRPVAVGRRAGTVAIPSAATVGVATATAWGHHWSVAGERCEGHPSV